jgi:Rieske Fe-S protein
MVNPDSRLVNRRGLLSGLVVGLLGAMGATLAALAGGAIVAPRTRRWPPMWIDAGALDRLSERRPNEVVLTIDRYDGYVRVRERRSVYLLRDGDSVRALSAVCTHLGCRVAWDHGADVFRCPCHGGRYTANGAVAGGPPPRGLDELPARVHHDRVVVQVA